MSPFARSSAVHARGIFQGVTTACAKRPYEIIGERVIVHDDGREIQIKIRTNRSGSRIAGSADGRNYA